MYKKDFTWFEDMDLFDQNVFIDLIVSIIENKRKFQQEEQHGESSDLCKVE